MPSEISPLEELQRIVMESVSQLCAHSTQLRAALESRNIRVIELEKTLRGIEMRISALAARDNVPAAEAVELLAIIKAACASASARKGLPS